MAEPKFNGIIGKTYKESKGEWPKLPAPHKGAPNVVVILLDDVGFGQLSTYGGPINNFNLNYNLSIINKETTFNRTFIFMYALLDIHLSFCNI